MDTRYATESISLKAIHTMLALLLQKPSKMSNIRNHLGALKRRLQLWERREIKSLLLEAETGCAISRYTIQRFTFTIYDVRFTHKLSKQT